MSLLRSSLVALPFFLLYGVRKYIERQWGRCKNKIRLDGKITIVTGANSGIGYAVAKELVHRNATVVFACRSLKNAENAIEKIRKEVGPSAQMIPMELDLASLKSIKNFAINFRKRFECLDILINNAGVSHSGQIKRELTKDNLEIHFGVNHLGHFYLTNLLLDSLEKSRPSRVIVVSSKLHEKGKLNLDDLNSFKEENSKILYSNSKLANVYFCKELAAKTADRGIEVFAVCPGWVYTNLFRHYIKWYHYLLLSPIAFFFMRSANQGAQTIVYCATEPGLQSGIIYRDCKMYESKHEFDPIVSKQLWIKTEEIIEMINKN